MGWGDGSAVLLHKPQGLSSDTQHPHKLNVVTHPHLSTVGADTEGCLGLAGCQLSSQVQ